MAKNPLIKRYLDAGMAFTQMTQSRAEAIVKDLVKQGEVKSKQAEGLIEELIERSRANTEGLLEMVRTEVRDQLVSLGLLDAEDAAGTTPAPTATPVTDEAVAPTPPAAEKAPARKSTARKSTPRKAPAKKSAATRSVPQSTPAKSGAVGPVAPKKAAPKKATPKKAAAKKAAAKKAAPGTSGAPSSAS